MEIKFEGPGSFVDSLTRRSLLGDRFIDLGVWFERYRVCASGGEWNSDVRDVCGIHFDILTDVHDPLCQIQRDCAYSGWNLVNFGGGLCHLLTG